jgi:two-component system LytT family sensor kinase
MPRRFWRWSCWARWEPTCCTAVQVKVDYAYTGLSVSWPRAIGAALTEWYLWGLVSPIFLWLARRFPFERGAWLRSLLVHLPATLVATLVKLVIETTIIERTGIVPVRPANMAELNASLLTCWLLVLGSHALVQYRAAQERQRSELRLTAELSRAQLQLLKSQLHPHFLFNTLHAIGTLMHRDVPAAETMLTRLSELLRMSLETGDRAEVTLNDELAFNRTYLEIQQVRFGDRLRTRVDVDPRLLDARVPSMILQPLVENAIHHGVAPRAGGGTVQIRARPVGRQLELVVEDDGPGLGPDGQVADGIGLCNTRRRLSELYGDDASLELSSPDSGGLSVTVTLPWRRMEAAEAEDGR